MTPLGFKRRDRKRLKRCAHRRAASFRSVDNEDIIVQCETCGSRGRVAACRSQMSMIALQDPISFIPHRVARKASDA